MSDIFVRQGLDIARAIVRRRFLDAFDNGGTKVLTMVIADLALAMDELESEETMRGHISQLMTMQHSDEDITKIVE